MTTVKPRRVRTIACAAALLTVAAALSPAANAADGSTVLMTCAGTVAATYSPGLTYTPKPTAISSHAVIGCPLPIGSRAATATFGGRSNGTLSCLAGPASGTLTFHWDENRAFHGDKRETSTASITSIVTLRPNGNMVTASTGTITSGRFAGATVVTEVTLPASSATACLTSQGLTSASGPTTVTIARL
ncbi:hypothetical protein AB0F13_20660 [Streptomyces sp. NPDC026206]|uniref:hypothetical protein n=1 Tax=Streptomyces sp. NPDC026206 TaxID=3157089 RepID=UPI0033DE824F